MPYVLRERVEGELDRLERESIIEPVEFSNWAAPIVPVVKRDGSIRVCGDYKLTVNQVAKVDSYPLPLIEGLCLTGRREVVHQTRLGPSLPAGEAG